MCSEEKIYIRNDNRKSTVHQKWVKQETKRLHDQLEKIQTMKIPHASHYTAIQKNSILTGKTIKNKFSGVCKRIEKNGIQFQKLEFQRKLKPIQEHWKIVSEISLLMKSELLIS